MIQNLKDGRIRPDRIKRKKDSQYSRRSKHHGLLAKMPGEEFALTGVAYNMAECVPRESWQDGVWKQIHCHYTNSIIIILLACQAKKRGSSEIFITALNPQQAGGRRREVTTAKLRMERVADVSHVHICVFAFRSRANATPSTR